MDRLEKLFYDVSKYAKVHLQQFVYVICNSLHQITLVCF